MTLNKKLCKEYITNLDFIDKILEIEKERIDYLKSNDGINTNKIKKNTIKDIYVKKDNKNNEINDSTKNIISLYDCEIIFRPYKRQVEIISQKTCDSRYIFSYKLSKEKKTEFLEINFESEKSINNNILKISDRNLVESLVFSSKNIDIFNSICNFLTGEYIGYYKNEKDIYIPDTFSMTYIHKNDNNITIYGKGECNGKNYFIEGSGILYYNKELIRDNNVKLYTDKNINSINIGKVEFKKYFI